MGGTDTGVAPTHKTPSVVWRATIARLSRERVRPVCGLCGSVSLSQASRRSHQPHTLPGPVRRLPPRGGIRPRRGEPPSPNQGPDRSSEASDALVGTPLPTTPRPSARCARDEEPPAGPGRDSMRRRIALQHAVGLQTRIGPHHGTYDTICNILRRVRRDRTHSRESHVGSHGIPCSNVHPDRSRPSRLFRPRARCQ